MGPWNFWNLMSLSLLDWGFLHWGVHAQRQSEQAISLLGHLYALQGTGGDYRITSYSGDDQPTGA